MEGQQPGAGPLGRPPALPPCPAHLACTTPAVMPCSMFIAFRCLPPCFCFREHACCRAGAARCRAQAARAAPHAACAGAHNPPLAGTHTFHSGREVTGGDHSDATPLDASPPSLHSGKNPPHWHGWRPAACLPFSWPPPPGTSQFSLPLCVIHPTSGSNRWQEGDLGNAHESRQSGL